MFQKRSTELEIMDNLDLSGEVIAKTLKELEIINTWLGGNDIIIDGLNKILHNSTLPERIKIADLGCGGGDILKLVSKWAKKRTIKAELIGIDANSNTVEYAEKNSREYKDISFQDINIFSEDFKKQKFDIVTCTLFCHHFDDETLIDLFRQLNSQVKKGI